MPYPIRTPNNRLEYGEDLGIKKQKPKTLGDRLYRQRRSELKRSGLL